MATERSGTIEYAIRDLVVPAQKLEAQGKKIIKLNIGDPNKFDFDTPQFAKDAYIKAIREGHNYYSDSQGMPELREAIAAREKKFNKVVLDPDRVIITNGVSEGLLFLFGSLVEKGDNVLIPGPSYPPYTSYVKYFGGNPVEYRCIEEEGWQPDTEDIRNKVNERTKAIVVINPNNPTGAVYSKKTLQEIIGIAGEAGVPIISDEIYDQMNYKEHVSPCSLSRDVKFIQMNGVSKVYLAPGWRVGYIAFMNNFEDLFDACTRQARIRLCASTPAQYGYMAALKGPTTHIEQMKKKLKERRDFAYKRLNEIDGTSTAKPEATFYIFPKISHPKYKKDDKQFVLDLLHKEYVLFVNGSGFGKEFGTGHFRGVFLPPVKILEDAFNRLERFLKNA